MSILVDTNVLSELARPRPDANVATWVATLDHLVLSVITLEEVSFGLASKPNPRVTAWFDDFVPRHCRILAITAPIARQAGIMRGAFASRGQARSQADMLIAATAAQHGLSLATRNARDFQGCGIALVNPFQRAK